MVDRATLGRVGASGMSDEHGRLQSDGVHEGHGVGREVLGPIAAGGTVGVAVAALR